MPVGGVVQQILVKDGQEVQAGQVLMKLDTETSNEQKTLIRNPAQGHRRTLALKRTGAKLEFLELDLENGAGPHD